DNAHKWGFNHEMGPFEIWDAIGVEETISQMEKDGYPVADWVKDMVASGKKTFYQYDDKGIVRGYYDPQKQDYVSMAIDKNVIVIDELRAAGKVVEQLGSASLLDMGDGILLLEFHSKMN